MTRSVTLTLAIASSLAVTSCQVPRPTQQDEPKPAVAPSAAAAPTEPVQTTPPAPVPSSAPAPSAAPAAPLLPRPSNPSATPAPPKASPPHAASESKSATAPAAPPTAPKPSTLDLNSLEQRLKDTRAIGVFTKLSLKNQVDDLLSELRAYHRGTSKTPQSELRQQYDLLILKVLSLLQNGDPQLATAIASSREAIWGILMDPDKFAKI
jgi:hypothetical protein